MKIAIIGSRSITNCDVEKYIKEYYEFSTIEEIISGGAIGIDTLARELAKKHDKRLIEFKPDYKKLGKAAPIIRNKKIIDRADTIFVFWDGESKGTLFSIEYAKTKDKKIFIYTFSKYSSVSLHDI